VPSRAPTILLHWSYLYLYIWCIQWK